MQRVLSLLVLTAFSGGFCTHLAAQTQVRVEPVVFAPLVEQLPLSGSIVSPRYSDLATQVGGLVIDFQADLGDPVSAGDVLLRLDDLSARLELERLQARLEEAQLAFEDASRLADEGRRLIEDRNISRTQYESRLATESGQQARLKQLQAELDLQQVELDRHHLVAPFSGVIGFKHAEVGEWLNAGSPAVQLVQMNPLRVHASLPERYFGEVGPGTPVRISVDALPGRIIEAKIDTVVSSAQFDTRSFIARTDIPNGDLQLAPGMSAHLLFALDGGGARPVLQVPADAIVLRSDGSALVWVVRDGKAEAIAIASGRRQGDLVEVSGDTLSVEDVVVTLGNESLQPGQAITAVSR